MKKYRGIFIGVLVPLIMALSFSVSVLAAEPEEHDGDAETETEKIFLSDGDNNDNNDTGFIDPVSVTGVSLSKSSLTMVVGQTATLTVTVEPSDATNDE